MSTTTVPTGYPVVHRLETPSDEEIERVTEILVAAFDGDPFTNILMGGDLSLAPHQLRANARAAAVGGEIHVACIGDQLEDIVGAAIWYPPGTSGMASEDQRAQGWNQFIAMLSDELRRWWMDYFIPSIKRLSAEPLGDDYLLNSWHLHIFGVLPQYQGKGIGKKMFKFVDDKAQKDNRAIALETTTELDLLIYSRFGCKVRNEIDLHSKWGDGKVYLMTKE
ncbi:hypothetical protein BDQ12DRAFT_678231 [Crucibulum laeve]|uniref:N-acetyltransferase domain-containing protein n=1 Tax=Crucibulum laeve TaxID=68775 RepID=A0A5C3MCN3_9AGAR|nr:hypothetical protein BDQ12DRAFT_678231 [Crucibulum laeve]